VLAAEIGEVAMRAAQGMRRAVQDGELKERFDEAMHPFGSALAGLNGGPMLLDGAFPGERELRLAKDHGNRRAKFVSRIRSEPRLLREGGFQPLEGVVENGGELAEFAFRFTGLDALCQIAGRDARGGGADFRNGTDGARGEHPAASQPEGQDGHSESAQLPREILHLPMHDFVRAPNEETFAGGSKGIGLAKCAARPKVFSKIGSLNVAHRTCNAVRWIVRFGDGRPVARPDVKIEWGIASRSEETFDLGGLKYIGGWAFVASGGMTLTGTGS